MTGKREPTAGKGGYGKERRRRKAEMIGRERYISEVNPQTELGTGKDVFRLENGNTKVNCNYKFMMSIKITQINEDKTQKMV